MSSRIKTLVVTLLVTLVSPSSMAVAAVKQGAVCSKAGSIATASGKQFACVKSGKKLVWKQIIVNKPNSFKVELIAGEGCLIKGETIYKWSKGDNPIRIPQVDEKVGHFKYSHTDSYFEYIFAGWFSLPEEDERAYLVLREDENIYWPTRDILLFARCEKSDVSSSMNSFLTSLAPFQFL